MGNSFVLRPHRQNDLLLARWPLVRLAPRTVPGRSSPRRLGPARRLSILPCCRWYRRVSVVPASAATILGFIIFCIAHARGLSHAGTALRHNPLYAKLATLGMFLIALVVAPSAIDTWTVVRYFGGTRGAAVSVALLDRGARKIHFSGVGNVLGMVTLPGGESKNFVAMPGIVGHHMASVREFTYSWPLDSVLLIYSDGIGSHWSLNEYEGLAVHDPSLISAVIYRDRKRGRDDASVLAIRERSSA